MSDNEPSTGQSSPGNDKQAESIVDRLVFAALKEQTRARRWRVGFMLFFIVYISVVTIVFLSDSGDMGLEADGDKHTALVKLSGVIASGEAADAKNVISGLRSAFKHDDTAAIVIEINSPGGSPVQSAYIFDEIMRLKQEHKSIPVYAVVVDMAASGGYFVAAAADEIYVNQSSLVGSIGVRMDAFGFVELMKKIGVERRLLTAGENKGLFDPFLPEQNDQKAHLQSMLNEVHGHFIAAVKRGRGDRLVENDDTFSGLIWSGEKAMELGLVDAYGTTESIARDLEAEDIVDFTPKSNLLERIADRIGSSVGRGISEYFLGNMAIN
ncbi:MAG: S49 family peptidase [Gammaproteobacteria bacterium]|nr:S49 family peptidase [Gammaproteobacteria bacterium]